MGEPATNIKPLDGRVGGALDPDNQSSREENQQNEAANEDDSPTRVEQLLKNNQAELKDYIVKMVDSVSKKNSARAAINQEITAEFSTSEAKGLNRKGVKAALKYLDLSEADRDAFLLTFRIVLESMGNPIQKDLFLDTAEFNQEQAAV